MIRPERFARLVTLAGSLIGAARDDGSLPTDQVLDELNISLDELREDLDVLNVVNFGGGTYVLYAEIVGDRIEVDPDTYGDNFARPARLLPLEAKALVAAIDLFGDHLPQSGLQSARRKIVEALGHDPSEGGAGDRARGATTPRSCAPSTRRSSATGCSSSSTTRRTRTTSSSARSSPTSWSRARRAGTSAASTSAAGATRHFRLDRMKEATMTDREFEPREGVEEALAEQEWLVHGEVTTAGVARVWVAPDRARWLREERTVVEELSDGAVVVELPYGSSRLARPRGAQGRRRPGRARAHRGPRGGPEGGRWLSAAEAAPGHPEIVRVVAPNPGPMTLEGTNTYVVVRRAYVIDPGPDDAGHLERVREAAGGRDRRRAAHARPLGPLRRSRGAGRGSAVGTAKREGEMEAMRRALEAGSVEARDDFVPDTGTNRHASGEVGPFTVIATPGHAADHVCFVLGDVCFCGDLILGAGSSIVPPAAGGGSLADYMRSLEAARRARRGAARPRPRPLDHRPRGEDRRVREHRLERERRLLAALDRGERSRAALLAERLGRRPRAAAPRGGDRDAGAPREARGRGPARRRRAD